MSRIVRELLRRLLPPEWADDAVGDLTEEWREWRHDRGVLLAAWRAVLHVGSLLLHGAVFRLRGLPDAGADVGSIARRLVRRPLVPLSVALVLGPALAAAGAFATLTYRVLIEPLPIPEVDRLVVVDHVSARVREGYQSAELHARYAADAASAGSAGLFRLDGANVALPGGARRLLALHATAPALELLGLEPLHGDLPGPGSEGGRSRRPFADGLVLSHDLWAEHFQGDASVIGVSLEVDGAERTIVAVLSPDSRVLGPAPELILVTTPDPDAGVGSFAWTGSLIRLRPGRSARDLQDDVSRILFTASEQDTDAADVARLREAGIHPRVRSLRLWRAARSTPLLLTGIGTSLLLLLLAQAAVLGLAAGASRRTDASVRIALGATARRLRSYARLEAASLLAGACVVGGVGAAIATRWLSVALALPVPQERTTALAAAWAAMLLGMAAVPVHARLRCRPRGGGRRGSTALRTPLLTAQIAAAVVLVVGVVGLTRSGIHLARTDIGFAREGLVTYRIVAPEVDGEETAGRVELHEALKERVGSLPGVLGVGFGVGVPGAHGGWLRPWIVEGFPTPAGMMRAHRYRDVSVDYLDVLGISLVEGRRFESRDYEAGGADVAIVNEALARIYWGGAEQALGGRLSTDSGEWHTVVGVVHNTADLGPAAEVDPMIYRPLRPDAGEEPPAFVSHVVRGSASPAQIEEEVRAALAMMAPSVPAFAFESLGEAVRRTTLRERTALRLVAGASLVGLLAAALGLGGIVLLAIRERTHQIGVRKAVGAPDARLRVDAVRPALVPLLAGTTVGLALVAAGLRVPPDLLHDAGPWPVHVATALAILLPVLLGSGYVGARSIGRIDPASALRAD